MNCNVFPNLNKIRKSVSIFSLHTKKNLQVPYQFIHHPLYLLAEHRRAEDKEEQCCRNDKRSHHTAKEIHHHRLSLCKENRFQFLQKAARWPKPIKLAEMIIFRGDYALPPQTNTPKNDAKRHNLHRLACFTHHS